MNNKTNSQKGFLISLEAIIAILMFSIVLLSISFPKQESFSDLIIIQQENDLLRVWSKNSINENEMIQDAKLFFDNFQIQIDNKKILIGKECNKNAISSETILLDEKLIERKIRIIVYTNC
ncbi:MAG: hypothetical protein PHX27_00630 [Candidatus ainarchaeum sp.]|nr:hypothetical protein [Candidatus ainarchaeum sp.]